MQPYQLLTPQMVEVLLPTLGFSLILNVLLIGAIVFRGVRRWAFTTLSTYWIGLQMIRRTNK
jgi:hypothetical protein